jgi:hypothetical protein
MADAELTEGGAVVIVGVDDRLEVKVAGVNAEIGLPAATIEEILEESPR